MPLLVAIDGRSGTGKSTIAQDVAKKLGGVVIQSDDFYIGGPDEQWTNRTAQEKVDRVIDWKRLRNEVLEPLLAGRMASWHPFDFQTWQGLSSTTLTANPGQIIILDGIYSARPELADLIALSVLIETPNEERRARLVNREGANTMRAWHQVWDEAEDFYFTQLRPRQSYDLVIGNVW